MFHLFKNMLSIPKFNEQLYSATIYSPQNAPKGGSIYMYLQKYWIVYPCQFDLMKKYLILDCVVLTVSLDQTL